MSRMGVFVFPQAMNGRVMDMNIKTTKSEAIKYINTDYGLVTLS